MKEAKLYHVGEDGLVEGKALGRLCVYLSADYDQLKAENERLNKKLAWARELLDLVRDTVNDAANDSTRFTRKQIYSDQVLKIDAWLEANK